MLELRGVQAQYGKSRVLHGVTLDVREGEITVLVGRNGVGKTTTLDAILGLVDVTGGEVRFEGRRVSGLPPHEIPRRGIGYVPQGRRIFAELTVRENLEIGCVQGALDRQVLARVFGYFPRLEERLWQPGGTLSGGEQQMLAIGRALLGKPRLLLLDEPTEGLMPSLVALVEETVRRLRTEGVTILLVEQNLTTALAVADRVHVMEKGEVRMTATPAELRAAPEVLSRYLGVDRTARA
ncbi:MAG TPA: ABC transporter ATP-binding protein [Candidatus Binatia bacterium]|nr:ABC transporter ATP-binding protein [Candidatus Binatia bacterium]